MLSNFKTKQQDVKDHHQKTQIQRKMSKKSQFSNNSGSPKMDLDRSYNPDEPVAVGNSRADLEREFDPEKDLSRAKRQKLRILFNMFDYDNGGTIQAKEIMNLLRAMLGPTIPHKQLELIADRTLAETDTDNDGELTFTEFCDRLRMFCEVFGSRLMGENFEKSDFLRLF